MCFGLSPFFMGSTDRNRVEGPDTKAGSKEVEQIKYMDSLVTPSKVECAFIVPRLTNACLFVYVCIGWISV